MARLLLLLSLFVFACTNLEDANVPARETFIRFFGSARSYTAADLEPDLDGGFVLLGNVAPSTSSDAAAADKVPAFIVVKTDNQGSKQWEVKVDNANGNSILPVADGYLVTGEGIQLNPNSTVSSEFVNTSLLLMKLSTTGQVVAQYQKDSTAGGLAVDFEAVASTTYTDNNTTMVATLGSYKAPGGQEKTITLGFSAANVATPVWRKNLDLVGYDYAATNSLSYQTETSNLLWASTAVPADVNQVRYVSVVAVPPNYASPSNNSLYGKSDDGGHDVKDFRRSGTGFAAVGTYTNKAGNKNIFFVKVDPAGNVMSETARYFDGTETSDGTLAISKATAGESQDEGLALTFTRDGGFVIAGTLLQTPNRGNGGTDILLIKIDAFGNYMWNKLIGGSGNEVPSSIREMPDGTLLISGTSTISNVSSMFIMKTDGNGELKQ